MPGIPQHRNEKPQAQGGRFSVVEKGDCWGAAEVVSNTLQPESFLC
jgi:hypothetical protein